MFRIWFERGVPDSIAAALEGTAEILGPGTDTPNDLISHVAPAEAIIASSLVTYDASAMNRAPHLRVIARTGIGYDKIDILAATERGIAVCNTPDAPTVSTAEHTIALIFSVAKRLDEAQAALRRGGRDFFASHDGLELAGRGLGIVGAGRIGRSVAQLAGGIGMSVVAYDPFAPRSTDSGLEWVETLEELLRRSDVVSLHAPLTDQTRHLIDSEALATMRPGSILINTARGALVDLHALMEALGKGHLCGAGLDVTEPEPLPPDHPLLSQPNVVVTPHIAAATTAAKARLYEGAVRQALQVLRDEIPPHLVNPDVWPVRRTDPRLQEI